MRDDILTILSAISALFGGSAGITLLIRGFVKSRSGAWSRRHVQRLTLEEERDAADLQRRMAMDEVGDLRFVLKENGIDIPPIREELTRTLTPAEIKRLRTTKGK